MHIEDEPRFLRGVALFNEGEFLDASEEFEDLYFEAVRDEVDFVRVFLQISIGIHHVERGQLRAAVERLEEGVRIVSTVRDGRGWDLAKLAADVSDVVPRIEARIAGDCSKIEWPRIGRASR